jgi:hypothetical protein
MMVYEEVEVLLRISLILSEYEVSNYVHYSKYPYRADVKIARSALLAVCVKQLENCQADFCVILYWGV